MLADIPKNILRSLSKYINANYTTTPIFFEGQSYRDPELKTPYIELRMDGPRMKPRNSEEVYCNFQVNILISVSATQNYYLFHEIAGELTNLLYNKLDIQDANGAHIGCATPKTDRRQWLEINYFGLIDPKSDLIQGTVEIHFDVTLETT